MDSSSWERIETFTNAVMHAQRLRQLYISECCSETLMEHILSSNPDLQELSISYCDGFQLTNALPKLKSLAVLELEEISTFDVSMLTSLVSLAPNLHRLRLDCSLDQEVPLSCLQHLQHLEEFSLNLSGLPNGSLTQLLVPSGAQRLWPHLMALELCSIEKEDIDFVLSFCPQLRRLRLIDCFSGCNLKPIISSLRSIETLELSRLDTLNDEALEAFHCDTRKSIQDLSITACTLLSSPSFNHIINNLTNLRTLSVIGCPDVHLEDAEKLPFIVRFGVSKQYSAM